MPYIIETCVAGKTIEIHKYYTPRFHPPNEKRKLKKQVTSEAQEKVNQRQAEKKLRRLMNTNFVDGDFYVTFDIMKQFRPESSKALLKMIQNLIRSVKRKCAKKDISIKYIFCLEIGPKGACHCHMVINRIPAEWIRTSWTWGGIHIDPLYTDGEYGALAAYFIKYSAKTVITEGEQLGKRWYASRNLIKPKIRKRIMWASEFRKGIPKRKGYEVIPDSVREGVCEYNDCRYFSCILKRVTRVRQKKPKEGDQSEWIT